MMQKILITGGMGNLGSWLTHHFCSLEYEVTVLTKRIRTLEFEKKFKVLTCDIASLEACKAKLVEKYDIVIHAASMNDHFVEDFERNALLVNSMGTRNILECMKDNPPQHFIYLSTFHVYGNYSGEIVEESKPTPLNDYGATHLFAEFYVRQFHANFKVPYTILRLSNSYGCPKDYHSSKWYLILNDLSKNAFERHRIVLKSNTNATRDFIWMGDVCKVLTSLSRQIATNETYNLSSEKTYTLLHVAHAVKQAYETYFSRSIEIEVNEEDISEALPPVMICSQKLKKIVPYEALDHFEEEALEIFNFLEKKKT